MPRPTVKGKGRLIRETREGYFYRFPKGRFYIIRWLKSGGIHLYPTRNGELPQGFASRKEAEEYVQKWGMEDDSRIVTGSEASKYEVPKRW